ncbi:hypothetical protein SMI01S_12040 [Sphingobacterium mizutaii NBRC 14946 = DSM 11724]|uniref:Uncharacterized protein n=2 Tax=Sphingobacterium mizutaii TaxID=1010 RepID=A0AAJ4XEH1_9SPHI|nr:hypothetical protein [Sphingobacterium mizutaii]GEM67598.1 hypothetical protein SMI01S_12040 [Sphingobacterium mizutaii NBRC 14946 = DSM 11724]SDL14982.1 hypothetical protein SAMN05192578_1011538 [Sphingobacterium mizutaii]SNV52276.1 Uncharacterised protein [Sphingobacterium mizutaii]
MRKVAPGVIRSVYPFDYNKNNPMEGFNEWSEYIRIQNLQNSINSPRCFLITIDTEQLARVLEVKQMDNLIIQANQLINK